MAARTGQSIRAQAEETYAITLWTYLQLEDHRRIARSLARLERLDLAALIAVAQHIPRELGRLRQEEEQAITTGVTETEDLADSEQKLYERLRRQIRRPKKR